MSDAVDVDDSVSETSEPPQQPDPLLVAASERTALLRAALGKLPNKTGRIAAPPASMSKDRSPIWKYFCMVEYAEPSDDDKHVMCSVTMTTSAGNSKVCGIPLALSKSSSPYNYERHLLRAHPTEAVAYKAASVRTINSKSKSTDAAGGASSSGGGSGGTAAASSLSRAFARSSAINVQQQQQQVKEFQKRLVLWSAIEMKPCNIAASTGFQLVIAMAAPSYAAHAKMHHTTFDNLLVEVHQATKELVITKLREQRDFLFGEPFCALQTDLTTTYNRAFITLSISFVDSNFDFCRYSLVTREFPLDHKSVQVQAWIVGVTDEWFGDIMPVGFEPKEVYTAGTIDQGGNVFNAVRDAGIAALKCCAHRLNSAASWALGIGGKPPQKTCKNKPFLKLLTSVAKMVGVFSHASANNDALRRIQEQQVADMRTTVEELEEDAEALDAEAEEQGGARGGQGGAGDGEEDVEAGEGGPAAAAAAASGRASAVLNTVRRSDTRWTGNHSMLDRTLQLESAMELFFKHPDNRKLTGRHISAEQWSSVREACGILDSVAEVMRRIQGSDGKHLSTAHHLMLELRDIVQDQEHEIRPPAYGDDPVICPREDLTKCVRTLVKVLADEMSSRDLGVPANVTEQLAIVLDPRFKCRDSRFFPSAAKRARVERELRAVYHRMRLASVGATGDLGGGDAEVDSDDETPAAAAAPADEAGEPANKKPRLSLVQRRAAAALEQQLAEVAAANAAAAAAPPPQRSEVDMYLEQAAELKSDGFDVLAYWRKKGQPVIVEGVMVAPAEFPLLARVACQYLGIDATSCQPERNFSALSLTLERLRTMLASWKIEMMMFLRLNRHIIPEYAKVLEVEQQRLAQAQANTAEVEALLSDIVGISV